MTDNCETPIAKTNMLLAGDAEAVLAQHLPEEAVDLVFTSPPYFNAKPEYAEYETYEGFLEKMRDVFAECHRVLGEGRFLVVNTSPVLVERQSRSHASQRMAVPFDLHVAISGLGFDFIDDIIWMKPEGAGWATSRGRRFAHDRTPLQYKTVPVTEYLLVYRKKTDKLIDWNIRQHHDQAAVEKSKIPDGYERTNVWQIAPVSDEQHPAVFPVDLAERVIRYYSFVGDTVCDPFAGSGTVARASILTGRKFILIERQKDYVALAKENLVRWLGKDAEDVVTVGTSQLTAESVLL